MIENLLKKSLKKFSWAVRMARRHNARYKYFDWRSLLALDRQIWQEALSTANNGPKILMATCVGGHIASTNLESMLAVALTLRGCHLNFLLCDGMLPACMACEIQLNGRFLPKTNSLSRILCNNCYRPAMRHLDPIGIPIHTLGPYLKEQDRDRAEYLSLKVPLRDIRDYRLNGIAAGEHAYAGALRFFARGDLEGEACGDFILRQYFKASLAASYAMQNYLSENRPDVAVFNHGIYVPQGILGEVCRKLNVKVVNWNPAYRKNCFIFSHKDTYHHTMIQEPQAKWRHIQWNDMRAEKLMAYLQSRWHARNDWIWFNDRHNITDIRAIEASTGFNFKKPTIGLLTSVVWDAALHYPSSAFSSMLEWLFNSIEYFSKRADLQLLIRVHPAEIQGGLPSRQRIVNEIKRHFPALPENIYVIPPESKCSTYAMMMQCNSVIIYNTKTGIELSAYGIPIVVAGEAWVRNKGFTYDVKDPQEYHQILDELPFDARLSEDKKQLAQKYAYHFFFRRMIPLSFTAQSNGNPPFKMTCQRLSELLPGASKGLDTICNGIISEDDFIYDDESPVMMQKTECN